MPAHGMKEPTAATAGKKVTEQVSILSIMDCLTGVEGHCYIRPRFVALK
jgi:hypothetical protein